MILFFATIVFLLWVGGITALASTALFMAMDERWLAAVAWASLAMVVVAASVAITVNAALSDGHDNELCIRGHEEWARGKSVYKAWICDEWTSGR